MAWGELRQPRVFPGVWSFDAEGPWERPLITICWKLSFQWRLMSLIQPTNNEIPHRIIELSTSGTSLNFQNVHHLQPFSGFRSYPNQLFSQLDLFRRFPQRCWTFSRFQPQFGHFKLKDVVKTKLLTLIVTTINYQYDPWHFTMSQIINHYYHPMEIMATLWNLYKGDPPQICDDILYSKSILWGNNLDATAWVMIPWLLFIWQNLLVILSLSPMPRATQDTCSRIWWRSPCWQGWLCHQNDVGIRCVKIS